MEDRRNILLQFLQGRHVMALATHGDELGICTVLYACDDRLNLYFVSNPVSKHARNIGKSGMVGVAVFDSNQKSKDKKIGIQYYGKAVALKKRENIEHALKLWHKENPGLEKVVDADYVLKPDTDAKIYKISPITIKFFNEELYGEEGVEAFKFIEVEKQ